MSMPQFTAEHGVGRSKYTYVTGIRAVELFGIQPMYDCECQDGVCIDVDCAKKCMTFAEKVKCYASCGDDGKCWNDCLSSKSKKCIKDTCQCTP